VLATTDTPGQNPLPGARSEHDLLTGWFPDQTRTVLADTDATRRNLLDHLDGHRWLHASCHGDQALSAPTTGGLLPYDWNTTGLVTVTDLTAPGHTGGEFAFLSACKTAIGGTINVDEAITVASAMQHAGWRHVIGTLWSVWDTSAATITADLYPQLLRHGSLSTHNAAGALHRTTRALRDTSPDHPTTWAPFIHTGP
ncbi:CHAT domain-containing protein, partial [Staphylococcus capitis]|uniref:CHAT domain-containing protein n=1 Tax=Staphylococcus capitis TaxID=29388 RepID=UPI003CFD5910